MDLCFKLNDQLYTCRRSTLKKFPGSFLANCAAICDTSQPKSEFFEIDRDGTYFGLILDYMADQNSLRLSGFSRKEVERIKEEARYYYLDKLLNLCDQVLEHLPDIENCSPFGTCGILLFYTKEDLEIAIKRCDGLVILLGASILAGGDVKYLDLLIEHIDGKRAKIFIFCEGTTTFPAGGGRSSFTTRRMIRPYAQWEQMI